MRADEDPETRGVICVSLAPEGTDGLTNRLWEDPSSFCVLLSSQATWAGLLPCAGAEGRGGVRVGRAFAWAEGRAVGVCVFVFYTLEHDR